jgi:predicted Rossmann fold flavoprotein
MEFDVVVLGGGAAGLMCALEAGRRGRRVVVLERAEKVGKKILISGGGRCNFTNLHCTAGNFISGNRDFCRSALARFTPGDFVALVERHGIAWHEKRPYEGAAAGQLFCDGSAEEIVGMLVEECRAAGVRIFVGVDVMEVRQGDAGGFVVRIREQADAEGAEKLEEAETERRVETRRLHSGEIAARGLVVATGGLSIPKMGATSFGYEVARLFGHSVVETRPGLVPLTFGRGEARAFGELAGVSAMVEASCAGVSFREKMLITHRGLSGPAILQVSSYWGNASSHWGNGSGEPVWIDLAPGVEWTAVFRDGVKGREGGLDTSVGKRRDLAAARTALRRILPTRLADAWLSRHPPNDWTNAGLAAAEEGLHRWEVRPAGTEGYEKAEVTVGGVNTEELSSKTMESRLAPGLYFVGEVVDVTGWLGGFNFQWAWASGAAAGRAV